MSNQEKAIYFFKKTGLQNFLLWLLFLFISLGLGYATLNRYDPSKAAGLSDTGQYANLVDQSAPAVGHWKYRILVPYLARPIYYLVKGHTGAWSPTFFALLCVNAAFVATAVLILFWIGQMLFPNTTIGLMGALLYLLSFNVTNAQLVGFVDSGEALFLILVIWALFNDRWYLLPVFGILGTLAKETFAPMAVASAIGWWLIAGRKQPRSFSKLIWIFSMGLSSIIAIKGVHWSLGEGPVLPIGSGHHRQDFVFPLDRNFLYGFIWLFPLGVLRLRALPTSWIVASLAGFITILCFVMWQPITIPSFSRAAFNVTGGLLALSTAVFLESILVGNGRNPSSAPT